uniref:Uncharacterized protein n=1 Tax=Triticum urartu TaxID=4572 RepID=A0A8R7QAB3_TRIUA
MPYSGAMFPIDPLGPCKLAEVIVLERVMTLKELS